LLQDALKILQPPSVVPVPLDGSNAADTIFVKDMREMLGDFFAEKLLGDRAWARGVLGWTTVDS
jgi:transcription initiation factor TFIID subunit 6